MSDYEARFRAALRELEAIDVELGLVSGPYDHTATVSEVRAQVCIAGHAHKLALELECVLLDPVRFREPAYQALDTYRADLERMYPSPATLIGEPVLEGVDHDR